MVPVSVAAAPPMTERCQFGLCRSDATESVRRDRDEPFQHWMHLCALHVRFAALI